MFERLADRLLDVIGDHPGQTEILLELRRAWEEAPPGEVLLVLPGPETLFTDRFTAAEVVCTEPATVAIPVLEGG